MNAMLSSVRQGLDTRNAAGDRDMRPPRRAVRLILVVGAA